MILGREALPKLRFLEALLLILEQMGIKKIIHIAMEISFNI